MTRSQHERWMEARKVQAKFTNSFFERLTETVTTLISAEGGHFLVPTLEDLDSHEMTTATYMQGCYEEMAVAEANARMAKFNRDKVRAQVKLSNRDHYINGKEKLPTEAIQDAEVLQSPLVELAEQELAEAESQLCVIKGTLDCIKFKGSLLPGLRGSANRIQ